MKCGDCGKECDEKVGGLYFCNDCEKPAEDEYCDCEDEVLELDGLSGNYAICEKCGKAFRVSLSD